MKKNDLLTGHLPALLCIVAWGTSFLISKTLMASFTAVHLMWLRFAIAYLTLWILCPKWRFRWREEGQFLLISLFANTLYFLAENTALKLTQTSNVSILVATAPIFTALLLRLFGKSGRLTPRQLSGFAIAFTGVVLVVLNGAFELQLRPAGDLLALAAALCWAIYNILVREYAERFDSFFITGKLMFYGLLTATPLLLAGGGLPELRVLHHVEYRDPDDRCAEDERLSLRDPAAHAGRGHAAARRDGHASRHRRDRAGHRRHGAEQSRPRERLTDRVTHGTRARLMARPCSFRTYFASAFLTLPQTNNASASFAASGRRYGSTHRERIVPIARGSPPRAATTANQTVPAA